MSARKAQRAYSAVTDVEEEISEHLDSIPYSILRSRNAHRLLTEAADAMRLAATKLKVVRDHYEPIYNRSAAATTLAKRYLTVRKEARS